MVNDQNNTLLEITANQLKAVMSLHESLKKTYNSIIEVYEENLATDKALIQECRKVIDAQEKLISKQGEQIKTIQDKLNVLNKMINFRSLN